MGNKSSKGNSSAPVVTHKSAVQQQKTEAGGKAVVKVLVGIANLTPLGKVITKAAITIADKTDHGSATKYLGKTNSTVDMLPGGNLAQAIASSATHGKSDSALAKFDPKRQVVSKAQSTAKTTLHTIAPVQPSKRPSLASPPVSAKRPLTARLIPNKH